MAKPQFLKLVVLSFASIIVRSKCCILSGGMACRPLQGATFGGRLVFMGNRGDRSGPLSALVNRGGVLIFQTPRGSPRPLMGSGRGKIWIGRKTCQYSNSQLGVCPWTTEERPCLNPGLPCETDFVAPEPPSYAHSDPLEFTDVSAESIKVSWPEWDETTDLGVGPVTGYKILYRETNDTFQETGVLSRNTSYYRIDGLTGETTYEFHIVLVRDGIPAHGPPSNIQIIRTPCKKLEHVDLHVETSPMTGLEKSSFEVSWSLPNLSGNCSLIHQQVTLHRLDVSNCFSTSHTAPRREEFPTGVRRRVFTRLRSYSLYNITYLARSSAGTYVTSQLHRTAETIPTEAPRDLTYTRNGNNIRLSWLSPRCGHRNGEIIGYKRTVIRNGGTPWHRIRRGVQHTIQRVPRNVDWVFRVQACTATGCGPYAEERR